MEILALQLMESMDDRGGQGQINGRVIFIETAQNSERISVIIPVYKVERYLDKCVKSVLEQTYPNIEVLLIDDGSPDRCGELCDNWAARSPRVKVIHQENNGPAAARNEGIDSATGEYLAFIDGDDYISSDMLERLYRALISNGADMSICNVRFVDEENCPLDEKNRNLPVRDEVLTGLEAIQKLAGPHGWLFHIACGRLYRKILFSDIQFPRGMICSEDAYIAHRIFGKCEKVACISGSYYYYVQRKGSTTHNRNMQTYLNDAAAYLDRALFCGMRGLARCAAQSYWTAAMMLASASQNQASRPELHSELENILRIYRKNLHLCRSCTLKEKLQALLVGFSPKVYQFIFRNPARQRAKALLARKTEK